MSRMRYTDEDERGFSLIEMLIAMFVFSLFCTMVLTIYTSLVGQENGVHNRFLNTSEGQLTMDRMTEQLRSAVYCVCGSTTQSPIASADGNDITFYAALGGTNGPTKIQYQLSGNQLTETDWAASGGSSGNWTFASTPSAKMTDGSVGNSSSNPLFTYYNQAGTQITTSLGSPAQTVAVESVNVNLVLQNGGGQNAATIDDRVHLSNVDIVAADG